MLFEDFNFSNIELVWIKYHIAAESQISIFALQNGGRVSLVGWSCMTRTQPPRQRETGSASTHSTTTGSLSTHSWFGQPVSTNPSPVQYLYLGAYCLDAGHNSPQPPVSLFAWNENVHFLKRSLLQYTGIDLVPVPVSIQN
jgi:hypothetical protein